MGIDRELDLHLTRRQLFGLSARGIGIGALASLLGRGGLAAAEQTRACEDRRPGRTAAPCAARQARHLPAPVRRAVAARDVRLQAGAREVPGHADSRLGPPGPARHADDGAVVAAGREVHLQVRAARQSRHLGQRAAAAHREDRRRHHRHQDDVTRMRSITTRRSPSSRPGSSSRAGRAWARGSATASAPRTRTCRRSSCCSRRRRR